MKKLNERLLRSLERTIDDNKSKKEKLENKLQKLREDYISRNKESLDIPSHIMECPTCKRAYEASDVESKKEELQMNFNQHKAEDLTRIQADAKNVHEDIEKCTNMIIENEQELPQIVKSRHKNIMSTADILLELKKMEIPKNIEAPEYLEMKQHLSDLEAQYMDDDGEQAIKELKGQELQLNSEIAIMSSQLAYEAQNRVFKERVIELGKELQESSQRYADMEKIEYLCDLFTKTKVELLETSINVKFKYVSFKLFSPQINGGLKDTCEALINGVPISDANDASKFNAGLDIINTLNEYYQVTAPIFIDNRESVTDIIDTQSQVINLFVDAQENVLKVEV